MQEDLGGILLNLPWTFHSNSLKAHHFSLLFLKSTPTPYSFLIKWHHDPTSCPSQDVGINLPSYGLASLISLSPILSTPTAILLKKNTLTTSCLAFFNSLSSIISYLFSQLLILLTRNPILLSEWFFQITNLIVSLTDLKHFKTSSFLPLGKDPDSWNGTQKLIPFCLSSYITCHDPTCSSQNRMKTKNQNGSIEMYIYSVTQSCLILCVFMDSSLPRLFCLWNFPGKNGVDCHFLFQGIFLTQGLSPRLLLLLQW